MQEEESIKHFPGFTARLLVKACSFLGTSQIVSTAPNTAWLLSFDTHIVTRLESMPQHCHGVTTHLDTFFEHCSGVLYDKPHQAQKDNAEMTTKRS